MLARDEASASERRDDGPALKQEPGWRTGCNFYPRLGCRSIPEPHQGNPVRSRSWHDHSDIGLTLCERGEAHCSLSVVEADAALGYLQDRGRTEENSIRR